MARPDVYSDPCGAEDYMTELEAKVERLLQELEATREIVDTLRAEEKEWRREWDILESACDFWKQEAINRGYEE